MKFMKQVTNDSSEDEDESIKEGEQSQDEVDDNEDDGEGDEKEGDEGDEGDEVDDNEDFFDDKENITNNATNVATSRMSLGGGNKKIVLKKTDTTQKKLSTEKLVYEAIKELNEKRGSSAEAIRKYIMNKNPAADEKRMKNQIKRHIKKCLIDGTMVQIKRSFKLTNKHDMKRKQMEKEKLKAKKEKEKEKKKSSKEKKPSKIEKPKEKKVATKEKSSEKPKTAKIQKEETTNTKDKPKAEKPKLEKEGKSVINADSKKIMEKAKPKNKQPRKSVTLVVQPTKPRRKPIKRPRITVATSTKKTDYPAAVSASEPSTTAAVKATGRGKKK